MIELITGVLIGISLGLGSAIILYQPRLEKLMSLCSEWEVLAKKAVMEVK